MKRLLFLISAGLLISTPCYAHGFAGSGWLHPLTGIDHMLAMTAVGAWSAQFGNRAVFYVPAAFVAAMLLGGIWGFEHFVLPGIELGIALSVLLLGSAIALERPHGSRWLRFAGVMTAMIGFYLSINYLLAHSSIS